MSKFVVVVDMQHDFIDGVLGSPMAEVAREHIKDFLTTLTYDDHVIFTRDTHNKEYYFDTYEGQRLPVLHCERGTRGWCIDENLLLVARQHVGINHVYELNKNTFGTLDLGQGPNAILNKRNIKMTDEIIICGVCTDICVVSNAIILHTQFPQSKITCYANLCAGTSVEAHEAALMVMKSCQIEVKNV